MSTVPASAGTAPAVTAPKVTVAPKPGTEAPKTTTPAPALAPTDFKGTKHKIKLDGHESEVDYDELVRGYQKGQVSDKRYQEAAKLAGEAQKINQALEAGDVNFLVQKMGPQKARAMMENYLIEQMQYEQLPQHEKALITERQKRQELEEQLKSKEQAAEQQRYQLQADKAYQDLDREMGEALTAVGKKPNARLALRILEQIEARLVAKEQRIPASEAWQHARRGLTEDIRLIVPEMSAEELHEMLGKDVVEKLMSHKVNQVLDAKQHRRVKAPEKSSEPSKPRSIDDHYKELEQKLMKRR